MRYPPSAGFKHCYLVTVNRSESFKKNEAVKVKKRERDGGGEGVVVGRGGYGGGEWVLVGRGDGGGEWVVVGRGGGVSLRRK